MRVAFDTNVLVYAEGLNGTGRRDAALSLIRRLPQEAAVVPAQVLGGCSMCSFEEGESHELTPAMRFISWRDTFGVVETSSEVMLAAADLATDHQLGIWDAVILSAASRSGCRLLLSEDFQEGFTWGGVTVVNPFSWPQHPLLDALLAEDVQ